MESALLLFLVLAGLASVGSLLATWLKLPTLVLYVVAGVALGPGALELAITTEPAKSALKVLGEAGLLFLMFRSGAELDLQRFLRNHKQGILFGLLSFGLPFAGGMLVSEVLGLEGFAPSLLVGALCASHAPSFPEHLKECGIARGRAASAITGGTFLSDILAMAALAAIAGYVDAGQSARPLYEWALPIALYAACVFWVAPKVLSFLAKRLAENDIAEFAFIGAIAFGSAYAALALSFEPIVGAFMAGLAFNRLIPDKSVLMGRIRFFSDWLFLPAFAVSMVAGSGLAARLGDPALWAIALPLIVVIAAGKLLASILGAAALKLNAKETLLAFGLSIDKSIPFLAILKIGGAMSLAGYGGLAPPFFGPDFVPAAIVAFAASIAIGRIAVGFAAKKARQPVSIAQAEGGSRRIVVPMANYDTARGLLELAFSMRDKTGWEAVYPLSIVDETGDVERDLAKAERLLSPAVLRGNDLGVPVQAVTRVARNPAEGIAGAARDLRAQIVVIGWNSNPSLSQRLFGGYLEQLISLTSSLLAVARLPSALPRGGSFLLAIPPLVERHPGFNEALGACARLARERGGRLALVGERASIEAAGRFLDGLMEELQRSSHPLESWKDAAAALERLGSNDSSFLLLCARPGSLGWQPSVERLPHRIAKDRPSSPMIAFFLANDLESSVTSVGSTASLLEKAIEAGRVMLGAREAEPRLIAEGLLAQGMPGLGKDRLEAIAGALFPMEGISGIELTEGVLLHHAHVDDVEEPTLFVAARAPAKEGIKLLLLLLAPAGQAPERHLESLAEVAGLVRDGAVIRALVESGTLSELRFKLRDSRAGKDSPH
jgi:Kef-type K+ transport system membrane component KefB